VQIDFVAQVVSALDRLTFNDQIIIETGTTSYRRTHARKRRPTARTETG
jgi:hypothetical protein